MRLIFVELVDVEWNNWLFCLVCLCVLLSGHLSTGGKIVFSVGKKCHSIIITHLNAPHSLRFIYIKSVTVWSNYAFYNFPISLSPFSSSMILSRSLSLLPSFLSPWSFYFPIPCCHFSFFPDGHQTIRFLIPIFHTHHPNCISPSFHISSLS